jgi:hypothetical protein
LGKWIVESLNRRLRVQLIGEVKRRGKTPWEMKRQWMEKLMEDEELREIERRGGERVGDEEVRGR